MALYYSKKTTISKINKYKTLISFKKSKKLIKIPLEFFRKIEVHHNKMFASHYPPKSSKAMLSFGTPRLSSILKTASFIIGGPHR